MAKKTPFRGQPVVCEKCGAEAVGIPNHRHRRCGGGKGQALREKRAKRLAKQERGMWR